MLLFYFGACILCLILDMMGHDSFSQDFRTSKSAYNRAKTSLRLSLKRQSSHGLDSGIINKSLHGLELIRDCPSVHYPSSQTEDSITVPDFGIENDEDRRVR